MNHNPTVTPKNLSLHLLILHFSLDLIHSSGLGCLRISLGHNTCILCVVLVAVLDDAEQGHGPDDRPRQATLAGGSGTNDEGGAPAGDAEYYLIW